jgi:hypothetical protein
MAKKSTKLSTAPKQAQKANPAIPDTSTGVKAVAKITPKLSTEPIRNVSVNAHKYSVEQVLSGVDSASSMLQPGMTVLTNDIGGNEIVGVVMQIAPDFFRLGQVSRIRKGTVYRDSLGVNSSFTVHAGNPQTYVSILNGPHGKVWQNAEVEVVEQPKRIAADAVPHYEKCITGLEVNGIKVDGTFSIADIERTVLDELDRQGVL